MEIVPSLILQNPLVNRQPRSYFTNFTLHNVAEASASLSSVSQNTLPTTCLTEGPSELKSLNSVKVRHAQIIKEHQNGSSDTEIPSLITSYMKFGDFQSAAMLFFVGFAGNYLYWNNFLDEFKSFGRNPNEILVVFGELHIERVKFDGRILTVILKMCANLVDLRLGLEVHACLIKRGFDSDIYAKCALMNFYGRCWGIESAIKVFYEMPHRESLLWNEAILLNLRNERWTSAIELFGEMQSSCLKANSFTIAKILQACAKVEAVDEGKQIHGHVVRCALESHLLICNSLITMYSKTGNFQQARAVFDSMQNRDLSSWNSILSGYTSLGNLNEARKLFDEMETSKVKRDIITWNSLLSGHFINGSYQEVLAILRKMQISGFKPNAISINSVLQAISELGFLNFGKQIHCYVIRNGLDFDIYVGTSLVDMYVKNDDLRNARVSFECMKKRNIFAWNSLVCGYAYKGRFEDVLKLLNRMKNEEIEPDLVTYTGLVSGFSMWGHVKEALATIHRIKIAGLTPNVVTWTSLISGCSQNGKYEEALKFSVQMQQEGINPNSATILSLVQACAGLCFLHKGKEIHCLSIRNGLIEDAFVATALIDMYNKCGSLKNAYTVFRKIQNKTLASWNSMIMGFAIYSRGQKAIELFKEMREAGFEPDAITFTALLSSCKHSGLINQGWRFFDSMKKDYGIIPTVEHYSCMVDLLGKAGYIDEAWEFVKTMPIEPDGAVWGTLLGSSRTHGELELAEIAANELFKLEPHNPANYVLMMSSYTMSNRLEKVDHIRDLMNVMGVKNGRVWSWIQVNGRIHVFSALGNPHPDEGEIYFELYKLIPEMKSLGYVPDTKCVYPNFDEVEKEKVLLSHTEKLAITYGLIKTKNSGPIRVIKNTRICSDCHTAAKYMSLARSREILVKDGVRFHHFREGKCSCNDLW